MGYDRRLQKIERQLGCPACGESLYCEGCSASEPLPETISSGLDTLISAIVSRVGQEPLRAVLFRHPMPPFQGACPRCDTPRWCFRCYKRHGRALFRAIELTAEEQAQCQAIMAQCRALGGD